MYSQSKVLREYLAHLYWDSGILTNKTVLYNCPDITVFEKANKIVYLNYVSIPNVGNLQTAYTKNLRKYAELSIEVKELWSVGVM
jgi:hypothetical protein